SDPLILARIHAKIEPIFNTLRSSVLLRFSAYFFRDAHRIVSDFWPRIFPLPLAIRWAIVRVSHCEAVVIGSCVGDQFGITARGDSSVGKT
ncbi:MAG: hypothetical protein ACPGLY_05720, partial [Rubripirellula sp.]